MKEIEVEGKTVKEAIAIALAKLGVSRDAVKIKVLREEKKGLFGMKGQKQARVRVSLKEPAGPRPS